MHKAKAVVLSCMDFRFHDKIQGYLKEQGLLGSCDEISMAGCTRDFVVPVEDIDGQYVWKQLGLSIKLHDPDKIIFIDHQDCGGYAQDGTIPNELSKDEDMSKHVEFFKRLKPVLESKFPNKEIVFLYAPLEGDIEETRI